MLVKNVNGKYIYIKSPSGDKAPYYNLPPTGTECMTNYAERVYDGRKGGYHPANYILYLYSIDSSKTLGAVIVDGDLELEEIEKPEIDEALVKTYRTAPNKMNTYTGSGGTTSGSDPEVFAVTPRGNCVPAWMWLDKKGSGYYNPFWDGLQAEFTIEPKGCHGWVLDNIQTGLKATYNTLKSKFPKATLTGKSVLNIPRTALASAKEEHLALGCAPSTNVYGDFEIPSHASSLPWRCSGCHMHFEYTYGGKRDSKVAYNVISTMDKMAGVALTSLLQGLEDPRRRTLYGRAGEYRTPKYGFEWRVPSSGILWHPAITNFAFDFARWSFMLGAKGFHKVWVCSDEETQEAINNYNIPLCQKILKENEPILTYFLRKYGEGKTISKALSLIHNGISSEIELDIPSNWDLTSTWTTHCDGRGKNFNTFLHLK